MSLFLCSSVALRLLGFFSNQRNKNGAAWTVRTDDLLITNQLLCQRSTLAHIKCRLYYLLEQQCQYESPIEQSENGTYCCLQRCVLLIPCIFGIEIAFGFSLPFEAHYPLISRALQFISDFEVGFAVQIRSTCHSSSLKISVIFFFHITNLFSANNYLFWDPARDCRA